MYTSSVCVVFVAITWTLLWSFCAPVCLKWIEHLLRILAWEGWRIITTFLSGLFFNNLASLSVNILSSVEMRLLDSDESQSEMPVIFSVYRIHIWT
jgi:hypothetical protein